MLETLERHAASLSAATILVTLAGLSALLLTPGWIALVLINVGSVALVIGSRAREAVRSPILLSPIAVLALYLSLVYVARLLTVYSTDSIGSSQLGFYPSARTDPATIYSARLLSVGLLSFAAAFWLTARATKVPRPPFPARAEVNQQHEWSTRAWWVGTACLAISLLSAATVASELRHYSGGWQAALTVRQSFFGGQTFLLYGLQLYKIALLLILAVLVSRGRRLPIARSLLLWMPTVAFDLLGGSRSDVLLRNVLPFACLAVASLKSAPKRTTAALLVTAISVSFFIGYRQLVRHYVPDESKYVASTAPPSSKLGGLRVQGDEYAAFDALRLVVAATPQELPSRGVIRGLQSVATAPVPSALSNKVERSGSLVTRSLLPGLYVRGGNIAISGFADLYYWGGALTAVIGFGLLGALSAVGLVLLPRRASVYGRGVSLAVGWYSLTCLLPVLRADMSEVGVDAVRVILFLALWIALRVGGRHEGSN